MATSISAARAALFTLLQAALSPVQVTFGDPQAYEEQEVVSLQGLADADERSATLGNDSREEAYVTVVGIKVHNPSGTAPEVDARGFALADAVRAVVMANQTLTDTVRWAHPVATRTEGAQPEQAGGWFILLTVSIRCHQRIS